MEKPTRMGTAAALFLLVAAMTVGVVPASGQGPFRPPTAPDISGEWRLENNEEDTTAQPPLGDYLGIPFNDAGRLRSDTTAESIWGTPEYQCRPHSAPHQWRGLGGARILKEQDPLSREVRAYHVQFMRSLDRPIFMDGRPHPPAWAPHSWTGFSTGEWVGNTLKVTTTHLKDGYLKRGGPQTSDLYTMTEFITRHGEILTIVTVVDDPIYLDEPYVQSTTYVSDPTASVALETCNSSSFAENGGSDRHWVPHFLPGQNTALGEWLKKEDWVPAEAARGGVKTLYPEYRSTFNASGNATNLTVPSSRSAVSVEKQIADQSPRDGDVHVLPVQGNIYLLIADGTNLTASVGPEGILLVNTGTKKMSDKVLAAINQLANATVTPPAPNTCFGANCPGAWGWASPYMNAVISSPAPPKPLRYIIDTSASPDHVGGNEKLATAGFFPRGAGFGAAVANIGRAASVIAHENVLNRMSAPGGKELPAPAAAQPSDTYFDDLYKLPAYFNGEAVIVYHAPAANTDGDSLVYFRHSEVISAGDVFSTVSYPLIDVEKGGTIQGVLDGLNHILDLAVSEYRAQGGTWVIPGRGRVSDTADVASYRNMVTMIRDRVRDLKNKGMTIEQVKAARPTLDFDGRYGSSGCPPSLPSAGRSSFGAQPSPAAGLPAKAPSACAMSDGWTTEKFVEAVYRTLPEKREGKDRK